MRVLIAFSLFALAALAGCETYYKRPDSAHVAQVRFTGTAGNHTILVTQYESLKCELGSTGGIMGVVGGVNRDPLGNVPPHVKEAGNTLGMMGYSESTGLRPIERVVAADRDFVFTIHRIVDIRIEGPFVKTRTCTLTYQLTPRPGEQYEITYFEDSASCGAEAARLRLTSTGTVERVAEPSFRKTERQCSGTGAVK